MVYPSFKYIQHEYTLVAPIKNTLIFESKFESGNLSKAVKISEDEYNLYLEYDVETQGYTQWYYFSVKNYKPHHCVQFNIVNLLKPNSLYKDGLMPLVFSTEAYAKTSLDWQRGGFDIEYFQNSFERKFSVPNTPNFYYTLSFKYNFDYENDTVYFCHCYPYTYSTLMKYLEKLSEIPEYSSFLEISTLCKTLAGNICPILTITDSIASYKKHASEKSKTFSKKKGVVLTARVHPGETNSSYIIQGAIDFLLSESNQARNLRKKFVFKIVPMLNPDGVVYGNYRCSLLGVDLNRRWKEPNMHLHPTIFYTKEMIKYFQRTHHLFFFCDIHGHSTKKDAFLYGCKTKLTTKNEQKENIYIRLIPLILAKKNRLFNYDNCQFNLNKIKESTARIVIFKELGVLACYTLEASFLGNSSKIEDIFDIGKYTEIGSELCKIISFFRTPKKLLQAVEKIYRGIISIDTESTSLDISQSIESINIDCLESLFSNDDNKDSETDSAASENDDKKIEFRLSNPKLKIKKKKFPTVIKYISRISVNCAPSSLARSASGKKMKSIFNNTANFRLRKGSLKKIKIFTNTYY